MTKTKSYGGNNYKWIRYAIAFVGIFQTIVIYDTIRNTPSRRATLQLRKESSAIARRNGKVLTVVGSAARNSGVHVKSVISTESDWDHDDDDSFERSIIVSSSDAHNDNSGQGRGTVYWLNHNQFKDGKRDYYSGSWLLPMRYFESLDAKGMRILEDGSHHVFYENIKEVRMSVDWLDFAVEHMSRWYKGLDMFTARHNDVAIQKITGNLMKYIADTPERTKLLVGRPLLHPTIAVISASVISDGDSDVRVSRARELTITTLGATIASLLRAGFGRIVCTGIDDADRDAVIATYHRLMEQYKDRGDYIKTTEFAFVRMDEELYKTDLEDVNRPRGSIYGLQQAFQGAFNASYTEKWIGELHEPSYWKYVYFTEPDLVLQTKYASLPAIHKALEKGRVLMPHRFEAMPHEADLTDNANNIVYDGSNHMLPARGKFTDILDLDGDEDMCCDGGNNRPTFDKKNDPTDHACSDWWWNCGYTTKWLDAGISDEIRHWRLLKYLPFIRLTQGINLVSLSGTEHERRCHPRKRQTPDEICERPSPTGRSYATSEKKDE